MELIIFINTGNTFMFSNVTNFKHTTKWFKFDYEGVSTGTKRTAEFYYTSVSGYALN